MILTLNFLSLLFFFVLGAIVGSFLNVVILRYGTGRGVNGRSACLSCAAKLKWYHMVPVLSYLALRGRCASCRTKISKQYVLVEFLTGIIFALIAYTFFGFLLAGYIKTFVAVFIFDAIVACCAIVIAVYDLRHMIIPNPFVYTWAALGFLTQIISIGVMGVNELTILNLLAGPILFTFFWALWYFSKGTWMGFGDAKLALAIGLSLGLSRGVTAVVLGFWIGAATGIILMILSRSHYLRRKIGMKSEVPFGPFLIIGFFLAVFCNLDFVWMSGLFALY